MLAKIQNCIANDYVRNVSLVFSSAHLGPLGHTRRTIRSIPRAATIAAIGRAAYLRGGAVSR